MRILITFALESEFAPWRAMHEFRPDNWGGETAQVAQIGGAEVGVVLTGVGFDRASACVSRVLQSEFEALDICISSGFVGALRPEHLVATVLAARTVFSEQTQPDSTNGHLEGHPLLLAAAKECGATLVDSFYTASHAVGTAAEKRRLGSAADAVDMESFAVIRETEKSGVAAIAIRAVSDGVDEDLPLDMDRILSNGQVSIPRVLGQVARRPQALPGLMRLGKQSKNAAESLAHFLDRYIGAVTQHVGRLPRAFAAVVAEREIR